MKTIQIASICLIVGSLLAGALPAAAASQQAVEPEKPATKMLNLNAIESEWGIQPLTVRLTGADHFIDFRYRILDPEKAVSLLKRKQTVYLIHEPSGTQMPVPVTKLGPMRGSDVKPRANKQYAVLFNNVGKLTRKGDPVTIVIGDCRIGQMVVNPEVLAKKSVP